MTEQTADTAREERVEKYKKEYLKTGSIHVQTEAEKFGRDLVNQKVKVTRLIREKNKAISDYNEMAERKDACVELLTAEAAGEIDFENHGLKGKPEKDFAELEEDEVVSESEEDTSETNDQTVGNEVELEAEKKAAADF